MGGICEGTMRHILELLELAYVRAVIRWGENDKISRGIREDIDWIKAEISKAKTTT